MFRLRASPKTWIAIGVILALAAMAAIARSGSWPWRPRPEPVCGTDMVSSADIQSRLLDGEVGKLRGQLRAMTPPVTNADQLADLARFGWRIQERRAAFAILSVGEVTPESLGILGRDGAIGRLKLSFGPVLRTSGLSQERMLTELSSLAPVRQALVEANLRSDFSDFESLSALGPFQNLRSVSFENRSRPVDVTPLAGLGGLRALHIQTPGVARLDFLKGLSDLRYLSIDSTESLSDISPLRSSTKLKSIWLARTYIEDLTPLASLQDLRELDLNGSYKLSDLTPLVELKRLRRLGLYGCDAIRDYSPLLRIPSLEALAVGNPEPPGAFSIEPQVRRSDPRFGTLLNNWSRHDQKDWAAEKAERDREVFGE